MVTETVFFELLQVAIGNRQRLSSIPSHKEWMFLHEMADKQSLTGIVFHGVQLLPKEQWPPRDILFKLVASNEYINKSNSRTTEVCEKLCNMFRKYGFNSCVLKGQANHAYYDKDLSQQRICGDVDIWVVPQNKTVKHPVREVLMFLEKMGVVESLCYLHAEVKPINNVPVEVHFRPSFFNSPIRNRRFLNLFDFEKCVCQKEIDGIMMPVLKTEYDVIFQMNHLYRHLIDEGVGLRQVLDYYVLLKKWHQEGCVHSKDIRYMIQSLGMNRFACALMYVLREVFALPQELMLCEASVKDGQFLLNEIMAAGNFGHYDPRLAVLEVQKGKLSYQVKRTCRRFVRNMRFFQSYPEEVFWEPIARLTHFWWRKFKLWRI